MVQKHWYENSILTPDAMRKEIQPWFAKKYIQAWGGILFNVLLQEQTLYWGFLPYFFQGERKYHYNIKLPYQSEKTLIGSMTRDFKMTLLYKSKKTDPAFLLEIKNGYIEVMECLGYFLPKCKIEIDDISIGLLSSFTNEQILEKSLTNLAGLLKKDSYSF